MLHLRKTKFAKLAASLMSGALLLSASLTVKADITVTNFVNTSSGLITSGAQPPPVINDHGVIAFVANTSLYSGNASGLVYGSASNPGTIYALNNQTFDYNDGSDIHHGFIGQYSLGIDNSGNVLWMNDASSPSRRTLALVNTATPEQPQQFGTPGSMSSRSLGMNNNGLMAYRDNNRTEVRVFNRNTSEARTIYTGGFQSLYLSGGVSINDSGKVIYAVGGASGGVFVYDWDTDTNGTLAEATVALTPSNIAFPTGNPNLPHPAINNAGLAAFFALDANNDAVGLYTMNIGNPTGNANLIAAIGSLGDTSISLNDQGQILFLDSAMSLRFWDGDSLETVISVGDTFEGGIINSLSMSSYALNNNGDAVFSYWLDNGVSGVGLMSIPEPSSVLLLAGAASVFGIARMRRRFGHR